MEGETVNKLSYQPWTPAGKEELPWAQKQRYEPPTAKMVGESITHMSYSTPGYYVDDCTARSPICAN